MVMMMVMMVMVADCGSLCPFFGSFITSHPTCASGDGKDARVQLVEDYNDPNTPLSIFYQV